MSRSEPARSREQAYREDPEEMSREMATTAARAAGDMLANDVTIIDLRGMVSYTDYFVVASAGTERQTRRVAEEVVGRMKEAGHRPRSSRTDEGSSWISLDFYDVVVHILTDEARDYYRLESLWRAAPQERWEG
ncbi:ribosome silencing factor [Rubrobacter calidifluminis]|uniref:ribosome silencing factor n=1 Tax=Rubrobacter calidifluminis TaxID=1392640 RepID=UPI00235DE47F|nr:ribosome silencing factor [Rubrobacter calidifluminis]